MTIRIVALTPNGYADVGISDDELRYFGRTDDGELRIILDGIAYRTQPVPAFSHDDCVLISNHNELRAGRLPEPGLIYHYTTVSRALSILQSGQLNMSRFDSANDDRERQRWLFDVFCEDDTAPALTPITISHNLGNALQELWTYAAFSHESPWDQDSYPLANGTGWKQPSMWAHYAQRHKHHPDSSGVGAVLVFERKELLFSVCRFCGVL
ncbi:MAG: hypothetical protein EOO61_15140 [Hymenobacter sp.]|nr:MAG: hypothetical protein EOO61_15140 [Hymenobacter sp.]